jgi:hypothetical protein
VVCNLKNSRKTAVNIFARCYGGAACLCPFYIILQLLHISIYAAGTVVRPVYALRPFLYKSVSSLYFAFCVRQIIHILTLFFYTVLPLLLFALLVRFCVYALLFSVYPLRSLSVTVT